MVINPQHEDLEAQVIVAADRKHDYDAACLLALALKLSRRGKKKRKLQYIRTLSNIRCPYCVEGGQFKAMVDDDVSALDSLLSRLENVPTPSGTTPRQLREESFVQIEGT